MIQQVWFNDEISHGFSRLIDSYIFRYNFVLCVKFSFKTFTKKDPLEVW